MRIGVTVPLVSLIAVFLILNLFFGVWVLALPLAASAAFLIFYFGARRVINPISDLSTARSQGLNLFGLKNVPRFFGFLHIFCWFIPPVLFIIVWQIVGRAWMNAELTGIAIQVLAALEGLEGFDIDYAGMGEATRALFANYFLGTELAPAFQQFQAPFAEAFNEKFIARRWFWLALVMALVSVWRVVPDHLQGMRTGFWPQVGVGLVVIALAANGFVWMAAGAGLIGYLVAVSWLQSREYASPLLAKIFVVAGTAGILVWIHDATQWGPGGSYFSTLLLALSLAVLIYAGERPSLRRAPTIILLVGLGVFAFSTLVGALDMLGWVERTVAVEFGRPAPGAINTELGRIQRIIGELREGTQITQWHLDEFRAIPAHLEAAQSWLPLFELNQRIMFGGVLASLVLGALLSVILIRPSTNARIAHEATAQVLMVVASALAIFVTIGLVIALLGQAEVFFSLVPAQEFLNELTWNKGGINDGLEGQERKSTLGAIPVFYGTLMVSFLALAFSVPVGLLSAIYMSEYASKTIRNIFKPILEILAGVPTIVYGVFAFLVAGEVFRDVWAVTGEPLTGYEMAGRSALVAGVVMGIMLIPFISSLSDDALKAVPRPLRDGSLALGANKSETITKVLLPAALPGIMGGILLATSRAIGETMIVVLAAGRFAQIKANPLEPMTTVTVQIVEFLTGDIGLDSPEALSAFGFGLVLFLATLVLNMVAIIIVRSFRLKYS